MIFNLCCRQKLTPMRVLPPTRPGRSTGERLGFGSISANVRFTTLDEQVAVRFNRLRLIAPLTTLFGLLALVLACVGLYGVAAYMVARRTSEIGVSNALSPGLR